MLLTKFQMKRCLSLLQIYCKITVLLYIFFLPEAQTTTERR